MMISKNLFLIIVFIFLTHCGYTAVYKEDPNSEIKISLAKMEGNKEFNNKINSQLRRYYNNKAKNIFVININSRFNKETIAKDTTGKITNYELIAISNFQISYKNKNHNVSFKESLRIKNIDDAFEQRKYENIVKNNFATSMHEKLILKLRTLQ